MDWNFTEVFEEYSGSGGELLGSVWEAIGKCQGPCKAAIDARALQESVHGR